MPESAVIVHATCIAFDGKGALIVGPSGAGKSALALQLMAYGCQLVADDRTMLVARDGRLTASPAPHLSGLIEARGVGILAADHAAEAQVDMAIDMEQCELERLPTLRHREICGISVACLHKVEAPYFPAAVLQYLKGSRREPI
jgi:HPr kinase/phosphorylase